MDSKIYVQDLILVNPHYDTLQHTFPPEFIARTEMHNESPPNILWVQRVYFYPQDFVLLEESI